MKPSKKYLRELIRTSLVFGLAIPSSVNRELEDNGYETLPRIEILIEAQAMEAEEK